MAVLLQAAEAPTSRRLAKLLSWSHSCVCHIGSSNANRLSTEPCDEKGLDISSVVKQWATCIVLR